MSARTIHHKGVEITIWEQMIRVGGPPNLWLRRPVEEMDILAVKGFIDAGRSSLATELRALQEQTDNLLAS